MASPKYVDKRKNVMVGNLPDDFLRVSPPSSEAASPTHNLNSSAQPVQYRRFGPNNAVAQITVCIVQAQLTKNYSLTKMDPYVRVRIGHSVFETHADIRGGKLPNWNKTIISYLPQGIKSIYIEVFDERTLTADERIAHAEYDIPDEAMQGKFIDTWVPLSGRQGEGKEGSINITVYIAPSPPVMPAAAPIMVVPQPAIAPYYMPAQPIIQYPMVQPMMNPGYVYPAVQQQQCRPPISEEDIKQLQEMFPSFDKEVLLGVLESSGRNKESAISSLLSMSEK